jgi:hypothetical protein
LQIYHGQGDTPSKQSDSVKIFTPTSSPESVQLVSKPTTYVAPTCVSEDQELNPKSIDDAIQQSRDYVEKERKRQIEYLRNATQRKRASLAVKIIPVERGVGTSGAQSYANVHELYAPGATRINQGELTAPTKDIMQTYVARELDRVQKFPMQSRGLTGQFPTFEKVF